MPDFPHLKKAPIVEALIFFQVDASASWKPAEIRKKFSEMWTEHTEVQEIQALKMAFTVAPGENPKQEITQPGIEVLIFHSKTQPTAFQVRRDGFIASCLSPYPDWETFRAMATAEWERYAAIVGTPEPHSLFVRFINRIEIPAGEFQIEKTFTSHPSRPPGLDWQFGNFVQRAEFNVPNSNYCVQTVLARAFDTTPELLAFILDIEVKLREPLAALGKPIPEVLAEMRDLKNTAFYGLLTKEAWKRYL